MSLSESMKHLISAWESTPEDKQTLIDLTSRLMLEEDTKKSDNKTVALVTKSKFVKIKSEMKCYNCNKKGHLKKNCPELKQSNNTNSVIIVRKIAT